jgi:acyl-CoA synthetase (AMP-forming)/AMP-acid ligase II
VDVPTGVHTQPQFLHAVADRCADRAAIVLGERELTYRGLEERSALLARGLLSRGVGKGTRIGLLLANGPDWALTAMALLRIGAVVVPLSTFLKPPELSRVVRHADLHGLLFQPGFLGRDFRELVGAALPGIAATADPDIATAAAPYLRWVVLHDDEVHASVPSWARPLSWLIGGAGRIDPALLAAAEAEVHPADPAVMIYTSGQSSEPKGVLHTQGGITDKAHYLAATYAEPDGVEKDSTMPFFWVGGFAIDLLCTFAVGGTVICHDGATSMEPGGIIGATRGPGHDAPPDRLRPGLGMSETFAVYAWGHGPVRLDRPTCVPMSRFEPGYTVKVIGPEGDEQPEGVPGQIAIRGPSVTPGLQKVRRADVFDADGFYRTGDEGVFEDGVLYLLGRLSDMIKTSGANVSPAEVERELAGLPGVASAHVVGVPDPDRGQVVAAAIVPQPGVELDLAGLRTALRERLSSYKVPRLALVVAFDQIPTTPTMKIRKRDLATMLAEHGVPLDGTARRRPR